MMFATSTPGCRMLGWNQVMSSQPIIRQSFDSATLTATSSFWLSPDEHETGGTAALKGSDARQGKGTLPFNAATVHLHEQRVAGGGPVEQAPAHPDRAAPTPSKTSRCLP